jgi:predicted 3-demethylubiquinone-9 3-methyltransferase (glyoxalase superfamily)
MALSEQVKAESSNPRLVPYLSFQGRAEEAMNFYAEILPDAKIESLIRFEKGERGDEGKVLFGELSFFGQKIMFLDIEVGVECPKFSWATSFYLECRDEGEFDAVFAGLAQDGIVMMGPESILHFRKVAWVTDKFGVAWQPVLKHLQS